VKRIINPARKLRIWTDTRAWISLGWFCSNRSRVNFFVRWRAGAGGSCRCS